MKEILYDLYGYNTQLFIYANILLNSNEYLSYYLKVISYFFEIKNFAFYYCVLLLMCWFKIKKADARLQQKVYEKYAYELCKIGFAYAIFVAIFCGLKFSVNMPRPYCSLTPEQFKSIMDFSDVRCLSSFPSGHTGIALMIMYFTYVYASNMFIKFMTVLMFIAAALSRISLAMHFPVDVIYGILFSIIAIFSSNVFCVVAKYYLYKVYMWVYQFVFGRPII